MIKAVCECKKISENDLIVAVQRERFSFLDAWSGWTWVGVVILTLLTGGFWLLAVIGFHFNDILKPEFRCNQCNAIIVPKQFRL